MKTILLSNRLGIDPPIYDVDSFSWTTRPSVEGYPLVVLDLYFGEVDKQGFHPLGRDDYNFYELGTEVVRCLDSGGVVVAMLEPVAVTGRALQSQPYTGETRRYKEKRHGKDPLPPPTSEISYDWLDQGFLEVTHLDTLHSKATEGITWLFPDLQAYHLRSTAPRNWVSIKGTNAVTQGVVSYEVRDPARWSASRGISKSRYMVLAHGSHTKLPVAVALEYLDLRGLLGWYQL